MLAPDEQQLKLMRVLDANNGLYDFDEQLEPFGEDVIQQCYEAGWLDSEQCNHSDLFILTDEGKKFARAVDR